MDAVMLALEQYEQILGINYEITTDVNQATFRLIDDDVGRNSAPISIRRIRPTARSRASACSTSTAAAGDAFPQKPRSRAASPSRVILHEFGHAHGLAHPHDTGGGSDVMLGVTGSTGSLRHLRPQPGRLHRHVLQ